MAAHLCVLCSAAAKSKCSGCKMVYYCSTGCQKQHWKEHKPVCKAQQLSPQWSHDCYGKKHVVDLPVYADEVEKDVATELGLDCGEYLNLGMFPEGMDHLRENPASGRGIRMVNRENGTQLLVMNTPLYKDGGNGGCDGCAVDGIFVVAKRVRGELVWREVQRDDKEAPLGRKGLYKYMAQAKSEAKIPTAGVWK
eukprot:TRINITY_DN105389_c0_g1_i1.p1 TRINITY_DN105389_c0_g1~~TRINITY_DN105389_c0_g1_i1.p1  ORF type:complete len:195 (+),score=16.53 TRINITY_DN105389_c0_g1_i1:47-631(+)